MSSRVDIKDALVSKFKEIQGNNPYISNLYTNVLGKLKYWNEVTDFPFVCVTAGRETREYLPALTWGLLQIHIWIYINSETSDQDVEDVFTDIELIVDSNQELEYSTGKFTEDIRVLSITTDEGLMEPLRIGEILLQVRYGIDG